MLKETQVGLKQDLIDLGNLIRQIRQMKGWSQDMLSVRSGVTKAQISHIERANTTSRFTTISKIFNALEVSVAEAYQAF
jgi:transcriptional regulator with XRE-family HTH domain